ncbi:NADP-dependent oxidoreductase domain-containing protein [Gymnopilus junonius]|uniref:NADP-dependent oxidoreductase domain-containing protein n=1 Tax=Gymnopilus junonius TaxID=109634 RepID=A0A9P5NS18_GYMJU|nr:NADP-dependent oxidoreductase domain-containing protein [Gymnopilus junonius]
MASAKLTLNSNVRLSRSGHYIPLLGFGVYQNYDAKTSVLEAFKAGYRHIDTAQAYKNEAACADAIHESGLDRSDIFLTTKCISKTHGYESTKRGLDESLAKMRFDYIDLFLIHDPYAGKDLRLQTYKALLEGKSAGKIKAVGVSNFNVKHIEEIKAAGYELPDVNQIELHPFCQQKPIVEYCKANDIVVEAYCPIIRGKMDHPVIQEIAAKHSRDPAQVLIRWSLQKGYVPLPKSATPSRIHSNAQVYDFELDEEDMRKLDSLDRGKEGAISWNPVDVD